MTRLVLQGGPEVLQAASQAWPAAFSASRCRASTTGHCASLWLGPDEFLLLNDGPEDAREWLERIEGAIGDLAHSLVDISHRQCALILRADTAADWLNTGCPLDLHPRAFPVGMCTRTVFAKADIVLWRTGAAEFRVEVWRSFVEYVVSLLRETSRGLGRLHGVDVAPRAG
jgi:sarcosine oxidase subunit gamma